MVRGDTHRGRADGAPAPSKANAAWQTAMVTGLRARPRVCSHPRPAVVACTPDGHGCDPRGDQLRETRGGGLALRLAPGQERFGSSVRESPTGAAEYPQAKPWYRAVFFSGMCR